MEKPDNVRNMGLTRKTLEEIDTEVDRLENSGFKAENYELVKNNCRTFVDRLLFHLIGEHFLSRNTGFCVLT